MSLAQSLDGNAASKSNEEPPPSPDLTESDHGKDILPALLSATKSSANGSEGMDPQMIVRLLAIMKSLGQDGEN